MLFLCATRQTLRRHQAGSRAHARAMGMIERGEKELPPAHAAVALALPPPPPITLRLPMQKPAPTPTGAGAGAGAGEGAGGGPLRASAPLSGLSLSLPAAAPVMSERKARAVAAASAAAAAAAAGRERPGGVAAAPGGGLDAFGEASDRLPVALALPSKYVYTGGGQAALAVGTSAGGGQDDDSDSGSDGYFFKLPRWVFVFLCFLSTLAPPFACSLSVSVASQRARSLISSL